MSKRENEFRFSWKELDDAAELPQEFISLLQQADSAIAKSHSPYSGFAVGAAALLSNSKVVSASNQENASSPAGICAERVTLSAVSSLYPRDEIIALAIKIKSKHSVISHPVSPCGLCRQTILEYGMKQQKKIQLILQGETGKIIWIQDAADLLPLAFTKNELR
jgi:cytidine deaminase